jgi:succinate dehydrogenase / fumarate reductase, cytochrome b subunit
MSVTVASRASRGLTQKQWFSLFGVVPLSVYVVLHLWTNLYALAGAEAFDTRLVETRQSPTFLFLEVVGLGFPIVFHAWIGLKAVFQMRPNNASYHRLTNWKYLLQRISAVGILLFLAAHVLKARILPATATPDGHETWAGMHAALSEPLTFTVYALGLLGVAYHLANGLWLASLTWGIAVSPRAQRKMEWVTITFFVLLLAMSALALYGFRPFME